MSAVAIGSTTVVALLVAVRGLSGSWPQLGSGRQWRRPPGLRTWLAAADVPLTTVQFCVGSASVATLAALAAAVVTASPVAALLAATIGFLPAAAVARRGRRRAVAVAQAWAPALRLVVAGLGAGAALPRALAELEVGPPGLRSAFAGFAVAVRDRGMVDALEQVKARLADPSSDRVLEVLMLVQGWAGGVRPILADLAEAAAEDLLAAELHADAAGQRRIVDRVLVLLAWIVDVLLIAERDVVVTPAVAPLLAAALALSLLGIGFRHRRRSAAPRVLVPAAGASP